MRNTRQLSQRQINHNNINEQPTNENNNNEWKLEKKAHTQFRISETNGCIFDAVIFGVNEIRAHILKWHEFDVDCDSAHDTTW